VPSIRIALRRNRSVKRLFALAVAVAIVAFSFFPSFLPQAKAQGPPQVSIQIYDANGNLRTEFVKGESLRIVVFNSLPSYYVRVINPDGVILYQEHSTSQTFDSGLLSGLTNEVGSWEVEVDIFPTPFLPPPGTLFFWYGVKVYTVVPIAPFGVLGMFATCITGFGLKSVKARKRS
jgi:hypothetical protein